MVTEFIAKNWKLTAAIAGLGVVREAILRWKSIDLQGKVVLITGGSHGLGLAMAEEFAQQGTKLVICSREEDELVRASRHLAEFEAELLAVPCDITNPEQVQRLVEQATARFGSIDVVVNNAGVISVGPWQTLTRTDFEEAMLNRFLPGGEGAATTRFTGKESETPITQSFLTELSKQASQQYNENSSSTPS